MLHFEWSNFLDRPIAAGLLAVVFLTLGASVYGEFFRKSKNPRSKTA